MENMTDNITATEPTQTWEQKHAGKIAGSDISAILGINPYKTAYDVWLRIHGNSEPTPDNTNMMFGREIEPFIHKMTAVKRGVSADAITPIDSQEYARDGVTIVYSPDRILNQDEVLEFKNVGAFAARKFGEDGDPDGFPEHYMCQALMYARLMGLPKATGVAYFGGSDLREYPLQRDEALEKDIINTVIDWGKKYVIGDEEPEFEDSPDARNHMFSRFNLDGDIVKEATSYQAQLAERARELDREIKRLTTEKDSAIYKVIASFEDGVKTITGEFGRITVFERAGAPSWKNIATAIADRYGLKKEELDNYIEQNKGKASKSIKTTYKD